MQDNNKCTIQNSPFDDSYVSAYSSAEPFPHIIVDNFLSNSSIRKMEEDFYSYDDEVWDIHGVPFNTEYGQKKQIYNTDSMPTSIANFFNMCMTNEFIESLSSLTGFSIDSADLYGGGMNVYSSGASLKVHSDFNYNNNIDAYRCLNLLFYLNSGWCEDDGGCIQLWDKEMNSCVDVSPISNRLLVFSTNSETPHGVTKVKNGSYRKSLSVYYYVKHPEKLINADPHRTLWK